MRKEKLLFTLIILLSFFLRFYNLSSNPPALYWDEASLGYNAYSIANYGIDEHGEHYPLVRFIAFGDYKPPGYIYVAALAIKLFGLSEFSIRLPSAFAGVALVAITYYLSRLLFTSNKTALLSSLTMAVSPWSIQLSRGAFEANLAAFLSAAGVYFFLYGVVKSKPFFIPTALLFLVASFYTFNANRIIAPLLIILLSLFFAVNLWRMKKLVTVSYLFALLLVVPSIPFLLSPQGKLRYKEVSIFNDLAIIKKANERIAREDGAWWARVIHNRRVLYAKEYLKHFVDHFNPRYLFISGDVNPRLSVQAVGELYLYELPFLVIGFFTLVKKKKFIFLLLVLWLTIALVPAATARETPHALRTASLMPVYQIIIGYGGYTLCQALRRKANTKHLLWQNGSDKENRSTILRINKRKYYGVLFIILSIIAGSWFYYLHYYFIHYPKDWAGEWQDGYKEMVAEVATLAPFYDKVVVSTYRGRPYIYFLLYQKISPKEYLQTRRGGLDAQGFWHVEGFGKYYFGTQFNNKLLGRKLFVGGPTEITKKERILKRIYSQNGEVAFVIAEN